jgi:protein arginine N-methyltransferase 1
VLQVSFHYRAGGSLPSLEATMRANVVGQTADQPAQRAVEFA